MFRKAVAYACNRPYITNNLLQGYGDVGYSIVPPENDVYYNQSIKKYEHNIEKAEDLLVQQNEIWQGKFLDFPNWDSPDDGWYPIPRRNSSGEIYADIETIELLTPTAKYDPIRAKAGIRIATTLREELGVNIRATPLNYQSYVGSLDPGVRDFDIYLFGRTISYLKPLSNIESISHSNNDKTNGWNSAGFRNSNLDDVVEKARDSKNQEDQIKYVKQLQGIISEELPYNMLYYRDMVQGFRKEWSGWVKWPGGIWNRYSWGHLRYNPYSGPGIRITAPTDVCKESVHDIKIYIFDENKNRVEGERLELSVSHPDASFKAKTSPVTDINGVVNATFIAPNVFEPTIVTLTVKRPENDNKKNGTKHTGLSSRTITTLSRY